MQYLFQRFAAAGVARIPQYLRCGETYLDVRGLDQLPLSYDLQKIGVIPQYAGPRMVPLLAAFKGYTELTPDGLGVRLNADGKVREFRCPDFYNYQLDGEKCESIDALPASVIQRTDYRYFQCYTYRISFNLAGDGEGVLLNAPNQVYTTAAYTLSKSSDSSGREI